MTDTAVPLHILRAAARRSALGYGLRKTARAVGLTAPGLDNFLKGCKPREDTLRKLTEWYFRNGAQSVEVSPELAEAALSVLLDRLPAEEPQRGRTRSVILRKLARGYRAAGVEPPPWLADLG
jgi:hypothetical protein